MQKKFFHVYGGNILDKYTVKLYARAYQDLEEIYSYIANSLLEPDTALNMVDALETRSLAWLNFRNAERSDALELIQIRITASYF